MVGQRTTNSAESYHGKLRHHFKTKCKLGEWIVRFKEVMFYPLTLITNYFQLQHAEEENASDVHHGRQPPRKQAVESVELSKKIAAAQSDFALVLANQINNEDFEEELSAFLLKIGYLMGYNNRPAQHEGEIVMEEIPAAVVEQIEIDQEEEDGIAAANISEEPSGISLWSNY